MVIVGGDGDMDKHLCRLDKLKQDEFYTVHLESNKKLPCLYITCLKSNTAYTCFLKDNTATFYLVEDIITSSKLFLSYIEEKLDTEQMMLSKNAVVSAIKIFLEYHGDVSQCVQWIEEDFK